MNILLVGAGVFGASAALHLARLGAGHKITIIDPGPIPHPLAESTDISKIIRLDYGPDEDYLSLMEEALPVWRDWNRLQPRPLFHEDGVSFLTRAEMKPGGFEFESMRLLQAHGRSVERLQGAQIKQRFPAFEGFVDGYFNEQGGFAESAAVVSWMLEEAQKLGVILQQKIKALSLEQRGDRVIGVRCEGGAVLSADEVIVAAGSWVPTLLPELARCFRAVGQPVFHLRPPNAAAFSPPSFSVFGGDIAKTGFYGFPVSEGGVVKIANHGVGRAMHPESSQRATTQGEEEQLRAFVREHIPALEEADIVYRRVCVYCDTLDEHFWIARDPTRGGLTLATGGSGHGFKFAPVLGPLISDALFGRENRSSHKFRWRADETKLQGEEAARHR